nr:immunoglobulin heavy chain junction region [Macaca mulatta]MOW99099.1 immunoglobulin heavy chain junction region [Macaca mulatta]MOW99334.1 immunoglobulin heavy chain junction region [Macaca mulatta]MOW99650.1 immunoglobulin heavy chain junction region [Macaca mulatta]MOW99714.1 immunoglobulin heavy chain junction region [Macaca mulatta]
CVRDIGVHYSGSGYYDSW